MRELALHLLDIAENSVAAGSRNILIGVEEDLRADRLRMCVQDDGRGMDAEMVAKVVDPFVTTRTTRKVGLGIPLLKLAAESCNGFLKIDSTPGIGTRLEVEFQHSHIDRMPLGDLTSTLLNLLVAYPHIHWTFSYRVNDKDFFFDDAPIKAELQDVPLTEPDVLSFLREYLGGGIQDVRPVPEK